MYKGFVPNIAKAIVGGATFLPIRESLKNNFQEISTWKIGVISAIISTILVHPFDFFKTYVIGNISGKKIPFGNPYRGLSLNLARIVPHFCIMCEIFDYLMRRQLLRFDD